MSWGGESGPFSVPVPKVPLPGKNRSFGLRAGWQPSFFRMPRFFLLIPAAGGEKVWRHRRMAFQL